jgi:hypothetical protein
MLVMPRIERRPIARLKSSRTLSVYPTERSRPISADEKPLTPERRRIHERRKREHPVAQERRQGDRRADRKNLPGALRQILQHTRNPARREGVYVDETV